jgi:hypothetical protein
MLVYGINAALMWKLTEADTQTGSTVASQAPASMFVQAVMIIIAFGLTAFAEFHRSTASAVAALIGTVTGLVTFWSQEFQTVHEITNHETKVAFCGYMGNGRTYLCDVMRAFAAVTVILYIIRFILAVISTGLLILSTRSDTAYDPDVVHRGPSYFTGSASAKRIVIVASSVVAIMGATIASAALSHAIVKNEQISLVTSQPSLRLVQTIGLLAAMLGTLFAYDPTSEESRPHSTSALFAAGSALFSVSYFVYGILNTAFNGKVIVSSEWNPGTEALCQGGDFTPSTLCAIARATIAGDAISAIAVLPLAVLALMRFTELYTADRSQVNYANQSFQEESASFASSSTFRMIARALQWAAVAFMVMQCVLACVAMADDTTFGLSFAMFSLLLFGFYFLTIMPVMLILEFLSLHDNPSIASIVSSAITTLFLVPLVSGFEFGVAYPLGASYTSVDAPTLHKEVCSILKSDKWCGVASALAASTWGNSFIVWIVALLLTAISLSALCTRKPFARGDVSASTARKISTGIAVFTAVFSFWVYAIPQNIATIRRGEDTFAIASEGSFSWLMAAVSVGALAYACLSAPSERREVAWFAAYTSVFTAVYSFGSFPRLAYLLTHTAYVGDSEQPPCASLHTSSLDSDVCAQNASGITALGVDSILFVLLAFASIYVWSKTPTEGGVLDDPDSTMEEGNNYNDTLLADGETGSTYHQL